MYRRISAFALATALMTISFAGCKNASDTSGNQSTIKEDEKFHITWVGTDSMPVAKDTAVQKLLEEKFNVTIEPISISTSYNEKIGAMIGANNVPDVFYMKEPEDWQPLAQQGILANISLDLIKKNAPHVYKMVNDVDPAVWAIVEMNEKLWGIPKVATNEYNTAAAWRKDWLDKLGITKTPVTLQEFEDAFTKIRNNDPDGNGKKDTYGLTGLGGHSVRQFDAIFGAFGVMPGQWMIENGKVVMGTTTPQAKACLTLLNEWYKKELIDPEFITDTPSTAGAKFDNSRLGVLFSGAGNFHESTASGRQSLTIAKARNPKVEFAIGATPTGVDGKHGDWLWGPRTNFIVFSDSFGKDSVKVARVLKMFDAMLSDEELALRVVWGEKGRTYDYIDSAAGKQAGLKYLPPYDTDASQRAKEGIGQNGFYSMMVPLGAWALPEIADQYVNPGYKKLNEQFCDTKLYKDALMRPYLPSNSTYKNALDRLKTVAYSEFIAGTRSLDEWDSFVKEYNDKGGKILTQEAQKFYDETLKKYKK